MMTTKQYHENNFSFTAVKQLENLRINKLQRTNTERISPCISSSYRFIWPKSERQPVSHYCQFWMKEKQYWICGAEERRTPASNRPTRATDLTCACFPFLPPLTEVQNYMTNVCSVLYCTVLHCNIPTQKLKME